MAVKIAIANQKGGVGKTTTTLCLADAMKYCGFSVLIVDMDPQCNTTSEFISDTTDIPTIYDVFNDKMDLKECIITSERGSIVPGDKDLPEIDSKINSRMDRYMILKKKLSGVDDDYDFILFDTPPTLGTWMINAITAADGCICPILADKYAIDGLGALLKTIRDAKENTNPDLKVYGVLLNNYNQTKALHKEIWSTLPKIGKQLDFPVFKKPIRTCQEISKAQAVGKSLFETAPSSNAAVDYAEVLDELLKKIKRKGR